MQGKLRKIGDVTVRGKDLYIIGTCQHDTIRLNQTTHIVELLENLRTEKPHFGRGDVKTRELKDMFVAMRVFYCPQHNALTNDSVFTGEITHLYVGGAVGARLKICFAWSNAA
jgi:hypothetical protein